MVKPINVLILEDRPADAELMVHELRKAGFLPQWKRVETKEDYLVNLDQNLDLILADHVLPQFSSIKALHLLKEVGLDIPFIIISGSINEEEAVECMKQGAADYLLKDRLTRLGQAVSRTLELKKIQEEKRFNEDRFRNIFINASEGIFQATPNGKFLFVNPAMAQMYGYDSPEELIEQVTNIGSQLYVRQERRDEFRKLIGKQGLIKSFEIQMFRKNGQLFWVSVNARLVRDKKGDIQYYEGIHEDITELKKAEEERQQSLEKLRQAMGGIIQVISKTVETRDPYTAGHQQRTAALARAIAQEMGIDADTINGIHITGSIHDLGKISIPADILSKPTKLSEIEFSLIKTHAQTGYDILKNIDFPWPIARMVLQHHERLDGSGYPFGLSGREILKEAMILAVADVVEAIASHRPYRPAHGIEYALNEISKNRGTLYDPDAVEACLRLFHEKGFKLE